MRKILGSVLFSQLLLLITVSPVLALEIRITESGEAYFFQDRVLGKSTSELQNLGLTPFRTYSQERVTLLASENSVSVKIGESEARSDKDEPDQEDETEVEKVERVRMELPAGQTEKQQRTQELKEKAREAKKAEQERLKKEAKRVKEDVKEKSKATKEMYKQTVELTKEMRKAASDEAKAQAKKVVDEAKELKKENLKTLRDLNKEAYMKRLEEERQLKLGETLEVRSVANQQGGKGLELVSKEVRSKINGATFSVDTETNAIVLTTPSGKEHTLKHLPDQAMERIRSLPQVREEEAMPEIEIEAEGSTVVYKTKLATTKKFLGLFPRSIETEVRLDDATGSLKTSSVGADGFFDRVLNGLSF